MECGEARRWTWAAVEGASLLLELVEAAVEAVWSPCWLRASSASRRARTAACLRVRASFTVELRNSHVD